MNVVLGVIGIAVSIIYVGLAFWLLGDKSLSTLDPNEIGDFLAGIFSPLALLWLVLGFFQQGCELRASREALKLQAKELKNSVEQQKGLVEISRQQLQAEKDAREAERELNTKKVQPKLIVNSAGYGSDYLGNFTQNFKLVNAGHSITDVYLCWSVDVSCELKRISILGENDYRGFEIKGARSALLDNAILKVKYKDGLENLQEVNFLLSRVGDVNGAPYQIEKIEGRIVNA